MKYYFWLGLFSVYFLIAAVLYSPSLSGPWQYDDYAQILDEKVLTGRSLPMLLGSVFRFTAWPDGWTGTRDLVRATFLLNWQWWGKEPVGYRWINLLIHVVNATLVAGLVALLLERTKDEGRRTKEIRERQLPAFSLQLSAFSLAALAGLLFLVHPIQSQAVAYIAQRFTSMAAMFYLGTIVSWLVFLRSKSIIYYLSSIIFALLAFNSKEIAITLPVALLLVSLIIKSRSSSTSGPTTPSSSKPALPALPVLLVLPFFLLSLKIPLQVISSSYGPGGNRAIIGQIAAESLALKQKSSDLTRHDYFLTQINVVGTYLRLAVLPVRQTLDYDYPLTKSFDPKTIALAIFHLGLIGTGGWLLLGLRDKPSALSLKPLAFSPRLVGLGVLWFYLTLLPESSLVPITDLIYEHRVYLPMVGLIVALAGAAGIYTTYKSYKTYKTYIAAAAILWLLLLSAATVRRAYVWGNEVRLWHDVYAKAPHKPRANKNYGVVLAAAGRYEEGVQRLARAVELDPENADYWGNFGTAYLRWGKYEDASGKFLRAFELFAAQKDLSNLSNLSNLSEKDRRQAAQYMNDYGVSMVQLQKGDEALAAFEKALKIDPTLYAAWLGLGAAYNIKGDTEMAIKTFSQTVKDFPDQPDAYNNLAVMLKRAGRLQEAQKVLLKSPKLPK